jgi:uncharacterized radical SAM protein YgiQ
MSKNGYNAELPRRYLAMTGPSTALYDYNKYWAECFGTAPQLPMSRAEMDALAWDSCDIIIITGDAYVDHPSFGMAIIGRLLESQGFRVGIIAQPDWRTKDAFQQLGRPNLYFGVAAGNMDSMINRYTADKKVRNDDAYTPGGIGGKRPDRCSLVYSQRCKEAYGDVPVVLGGIEASLRRIAHFDYWQGAVRRSILLDASADLLLYGNAERAIVEVSHRIARGDRVEDMTDIRGTAFVRNVPTSRLKRLMVRTFCALFLMQDAIVTRPSFGYRHSKKFATMRSSMRMQAGFCTWRQILEMPAPWSRRTKRRISGSIRLRCL